MLVVEGELQTEEEAHGKTLSLSNDLGICMSRFVLATDLLNRTADREIFHTPENALRLRDDLQALLPQVRHFEDHVAQFPETTKHKLTWQCQSAISFFRKRIEEATALLQCTGIPYKEMHDAQQKIFLAQTMLRVPQLLLLRQTTRLDGPMLHALPPSSLPEFSATQTLEQCCATSRRQLWSVYMAMAIDPDGAQDLYQHSMNDHQKTMRALRTESQVLRYIEANSSDLSLHSPAVFDRIATAVPASS
jgi:hypothetical protein